ncbi:MAG TPA: glycoside hydrolase [Cyanobacteria bacterium UBA8156]|jgi:glycosyltransferase involved in cell wall biosynthesis|nr:glycoside hydrolase [Cyanobacteria bacterium UBA8156]
MKVLVLSWEFPPRIVGGISRHVAELYPELVKLGLEIVVATVEAPPAPSLETVDGLQVHRLVVEPNTHFFRWVDHLNQRLMEWGETQDSTTFQAIHAHDWLVADAAISLQSRWGLPLVATIHATEFGRYNGIYSDAQRHVHHKELNLAAKADRVIVCSEYMAQEVGRALHCPPAKIRVIPNGLSLARVNAHRPSPDFDRAAFRQQFAEPDEALVYYVGRISHEKGILVLLEAAPHILAACAHRVKFVAIGSGETHTHFLKQRTAHLGIAEQVLFTGFMADAEVARFQAVADCAVFPSLYEPFGIVALESFAAGVPVVVSSTGGLPEVVRHEETGLIARVNDGPALAAAVIRILQDRDLAQSLVVNAQQDLHTRFNWRRIAPLTLQVYQELVGVGAGKGYIKGC